MPTETPETPETPQPQIHAGAPAGQQSRSLTDSRDAGLAQHSVDEKTTETVMRSLQNAHRATATEHPGPWAPASYAKGTPYVDHDQVALLHKGEAVIPKERNTMAKSKAGLFDKVEKQVEQAPHISARRVKSGAWGIITISGDANEELNGEHIISQSVWDDLCAAYQREPQAFKSPAWKKVFADAASADAQANPSNGTVVSKSPSDIAGGVERKTVPFPKIVTKSSQGANNV